jgi:hypothetical protein
MVKRFARMKEREEINFTEPVVLHAYFDHRCTLIERGPCLDKREPLAQSKFSRILNMAEVSLRE